MKCPHCGKEIEDLKQPYRPFCSERCKLIDLGKWISGEYRVPALDKDDSREEKSMKDPEE
jgi:endogenous inhibitor of DNA gyrase (YacG/DUF329 family)